MSKDDACKSFEELCQMQIEQAKTDYYWPYYHIDVKVFENICKNVPLDMSNNQLDSKPKITSRLYDLLIYERAYQLTASPTLDTFSVGIMNTTDNCIHYHHCRVFVHGPNSEFQTSYWFGNNVLLYHNWDSVQIDGIRFSKSLNHSKVIIDTPVVSEGLIGWSILKQPFGIVEDTTTSGNSDIVKRMFTFNEPGHLNKFGGPIDVNLSIQYAGDSFGRKAMVKAIAAKERLKANRPFIMCIPSEMNKIAWLRCLLKNLVNTFKSGVGILCPEKTTQEQLRRRLDDDGLCLSISFSSTRPNKLKTELDYLIIYQAHSIGVTEAIESMSRVKSDGCIALIGDPRMPNLRVHNPQVREACGSILNWFYNRDRYPEYFEEGPCIAHYLGCFGYNREIFAIFNKLFYDGTLVNIEHTKANIIDNDLPISLISINGAVKAQGCSFYNEGEINSCVDMIQKLNGLGIKNQCIGVLTTFCGQKDKIIHALTGKYSDILVGIPQDFEQITRDYLIISTVESARRTSKGKRYPFSDLLYDKLCLNLALTRAIKRIVIVGDKDLLGGIDHWKQMLEASNIIIDPEIKVKVETD